MILVTGASGFVGAALSEELLKRSMEFRCAVRAPVLHHRPQILVGDINGDTDWTAAMEGVRTVIHLAGLAHVTRAGTPEEVRRYFAVNEDGTARLCEAARRAGVERLVYLSTVKVHGDHSPTSGFTEHDPVAPRGAYAQSKYAGELRVRAAGNEGLSFTIVRTPLVYGAGVKANFLALMKAVDRGMPLPFGRVVSNRRSITAVKNLVDAILHVAEHPKAAGETLFVADPEPISTRVLIEQIGVALHRDPHLIPVPISILRASGALLGRKQQMESVVDTLVVDTTRIRNVTSWQALQTTIAALAETAEWYKRREPNR